MLSPALAASPMGPWPHASQTAPLPLDLFTVAPVAGAAVALHRRFRARLRRSVLAHLRAAESAFGCELPDLIRKAKALDESRHFSPLVYHLHAALRDAMRGKDVTAVLDALRGWETAGTSDLYDTEYRVESILAEPWEAAHVRALRQSDPRDDLGNLTDGKTVMRGFVGSLPTEALQAYADALSLLRELEPVIAAEYDEYVCRLKLFHGKCLMGATSPRFFGAVFLRYEARETCPSLYFLEHLVHEVSHLHLYALMGEDPLFLNDESETYPSPLRSDPRPMMGVFHAAFVLARIVRTFRRLAQSKHAYQAEVARRLPELVRCFQEALETSEVNARPTERGARIIATMRASGEGR